MTYNIEIYLFFNSDLQFSHNINSIKISTRLKYFGLIYGLCVMYFVDCSLSS